MLLIARVVRSTTQKDKAIPLTAGLLEDRGLRRSEVSYDLLHGTDKMISVAIEGIVAHGPGGNKGTFLVL
jgi:hypothetical protein